MNREKYDRPNQIAHAFTLSGRHSRQRHEFQSKNIKKHTHNSRVFCVTTKGLFCVRIFFGDGIHESI